jgi:hypothetical protein
VRPAFTGSSRCRFNLTGRGSFSKSVNRIIDLIQAEDAGADSLKKISFKWMNYLMSYLSTTPLASMHNAADKSIVSVQKLSHAAADVVRGATTAIICTLA